MRLGALGSLQRGLLNVRANWRLALLGWVQSLLVALLTLASLLPFYFIFGFELPSVDAGMEEALEWTVELSERLLASLVTAPFWLALIASSALMMLSLMVYSFVQAGSFAVLNRGDRAAGPGAAPPVAGFEAFSWAEFQRLAGKFLWRFFWLFNLILLFWMGWVLLGFLSAMVIVLAGSAAGLGAGVGLAVAAALPLAFLFVVLLFWSPLAQAAMVESDCGVADSLRQGLVILTRRLGAVLGLFVVLLVVSFGMWIVFAMLSITLGTALSMFGTVGTVLSWGLQAVQWLVTAVFNLVIAATLISLGVGESVARQPPEPAA
jgi:hypothetical protein